MRNMKKVKKTEVRRTVTKNGAAKPIPSTQKYVFHQRNMPKDKDGYLDALYKLGHEFDNNVGKGFD
jgi:hypothetical protein